MRLWQVADLALWLVVGTLAIVAGAKLGQWLFPGPGWFVGAGVTAAGLGRVARRF